MWTRLAIRLSVAALKVVLERLKKKAERTPTMYDDDAVTVVQRFIELYESGGLHDIIEVSK